MFKGLRRASRLPPESMQVLLYQLTTHSKKYHEKSNPWVTERYTEYPIYDFITSLLMPFHRVKVL
jgi:hypothetical protein